MNNYEDPWAWTNQSQMVAPLGGSSLQASPASPAQIQQGRPGLITSVVEPMVTSKALDMGSDKLASMMTPASAALQSSAPLSAGVAPVSLEAMGGGAGLLPSAAAADGIGAGIGSALSGAAVAPVATEVGAMGAGALGSGITAGATGAGLTTAAAAAPAMAPLAAAGAANAWNPVGWGIAAYGAGKLLKLW